MRKPWLLLALLFCTVSCFMAACCQENSDCSPDSYCIKAPGNCEGEGVCTEIETAPCPDLWDPVCGCNGKTYGNDCEAASAGVCVAYEGECKEVCKGNDNCEKGYYCDKAVGDCEGEGVCTEIPDACVMISEPVCGCDGSTYDNACVAATAGVSIAHEGECVNEPPDCNEVYANPDKLWSPNHKYVNIGIMGVTDPDGDPLTITINSITQDEEVNEKGKGAGNTSPDGMGVGTSTASIRAERQGKGNGRVYKISFAATDPAGAECSGAVQVCVPHDQKPGHDCINDGYNYDSTVE